MDFSPGSRLGAWYSIEEQIGQGGMATVYRARHTVLDSRHAIKVLQPHLAADRELRLRFLEEGRIQAGMNHPHVLPITDLINEPGCAGLVMRWLDGSDLRGRLETGPVSLSDALTWTLQTLSALGHVHEQGVIHRDLKPENLFLERIRGGVHLQVMDFGIAKVVDKQRTRTGVAMGSLCYMSPEQIQDPRGVDHRSDLFAMGAILYELVCGRVAFDGQTDFEVMTRITEGRYPPLSESIPDAPVLADIIRRALMVDRAERFASADAFADALRAIQRTDLRTDRLAQLKARAARLGLDASSWWVPRDLTDEWLDGAAEKLDEQALARQSGLEERLAAAQSEITRLTADRAQLVRLRGEVASARQERDDLTLRLENRSRSFDDMAEARRMTMMELEAYEERLLRTLASERRLKLIIGALIAGGLLTMMFALAVG
jgi:serine/threonine protein kinase